MASSRPSNIMTMCCQIHKNSLGCNIWILPEIHHLKLRVVFFLDMAIQEHSLGGPMASLKHVLAVAAQLSWRRRLKCWTKGDHWQKSTHHAAHTQHENHLQHNVYNGNWKLIWFYPKSLWISSESRRGSWHREATSRLLIQFVRMCHNIAADWVCTVKDLRTANAALANELVRVRSEQDEVLRERVASKPQAMSTIMDGTWKSWQRLVEMQYRTRFRSCPVVFRNNWSCLRNKCPEMHKRSALQFILVH